MLSVLLPTLLRLCMLPGMQESPCYVLCRLLQHLSFLSSRAHRCLQVNSILCLRFASLSCDVSMAKTSVPPQPSLFKLCGLRFDTWQMRLHWYTGADWVWRSLRVTAAGKGAAEQKVLNFPWLSLLLSIWWQTARPISASTQCGTGGICFSSSCKQRIEARS